MLNVIVLWNTIYMDAALTQLRAEGYSVRDEDVARLYTRKDSFREGLCAGKPWGARLTFVIT